MRQVTSATCFWRREREPQILFYVWTMAEACLVVTVLFSMLSSTASSPNSILSGRRYLADGYNNNVAYYESYAYDLSSFSVRYEKCQYVRAYDDDIAADEDSDSPLAMKHFVLFRLCSSDDCEKCENSPYGKYVTEIDTYLKYTVQQQKQIFQNMCDNCQEEDCDEEEGECPSACGQLCTMYGNMENSSYIDASAFMECQQFNDGNRKLKERRTGSQNTRHLEGSGENQQVDDDNAEEEEEEDLVLYIGPRCSSGERRIVIGLFSDKNCWEPYDEVDVENLLGANLSYYFLEHTYRSSSDGHVCLTCAENDENYNQEDRNDADQVNEMCENLYNAAAKCESPTGISAGFIQTKRDKDEYENQVETEFLSCGFIDSLLWNSYTEKGEIDYISRQDVYVRVVTKLQAISLELIALGIMGLLVLGYYFQRKIAATEHASYLHGDSRAIAIWA